MSEEGVEEEAIAEEYGDIEYDEEFSEQDLTDLESARRPSLPRRKSSGYSRRSTHSRRSTESRRSVERPLLRRRSTASSAGSTDGLRGVRASQKIYILMEDLTIVIAGFKTSKLGFGIYAFFCVVTAGLAWLLFRWMPRWRVRLVGRRAPLRECDWVVIENQWGYERDTGFQSFDVLQIQVYPRPYFGAVARS